MLGEPTWRNTEWSQPARIDAGTDSVRLSTPSMASEDLDDEQLASESPSEHSALSPFDDTETLSEISSSVEECSTLSSSCIEPIGSEPVRTMQGGDGDYDEEPSTCDSNGVHVSHPALPRIVAECAFFLPWDGSPLSLHPRVMYRRRSSVHPKPTLCPIARFENWHASLNPGLSPTMYRPVADNYCVGKR